MRREIKEDDVLPTHPKSLLNQHHLMKLKQCQTFMRGNAGCKGSESVAKGKICGVANNTERRGIQNKKDREYGSFDASVPSDIDITDVLLSEGN